jgi:hypothetical protein
MTTFARRIADPVLPAGDALTEPAGVILPIWKT